MVATLAMVAGPVMAADFDGCRDLRDDFVRCAGELFVEADEFDFFDFDDGFFVESDGISQSFEQESEGGEVEQPFEVG